MRAGGDNTAVVFPRGNEEEGDNDDIPRLVASEEFSEMEQVD